MLILVEKVLFIYYVGDENYYVGFYYKFGDGVKVQLVVYKVVFVVRRVFCDED